MMDKQQQDVRARSRHLTRQDTETQSKPEDESGARQNAADWEMSSFDALRVNYLVSHRTHIRVH